MKILLSWLHEFLPIKPSAEQVQESLLSVGIEVSDVRYLGKGFEKVVVAKVLQKQRHPNADRLSLCVVTDGNENFQIVCGATNFQEGNHVLLAKEGSVLPNGMGIKKSKIRGVDSYGMLCSESELGLSEESQGICLLSDSTKLGDNAAITLNRDDWIFTLELTPNRGDCLSVTGVAREIAAAMNVIPKVPESISEGGRNEGLQVYVKDTEHVPRYVLRFIDSVQVLQSPSWLRHRLENCGIRSINNLVDITNYVMLERGQPLHVFDKNKVIGVIEVRRAQLGETIVCLDDVTRTLTTDDLVIADEKGPIAIAGVIGGSRTGVSLETTSVLLESAQFDPKMVRGTSKRLGVRTESSYRFERWVDPSFNWLSSIRAVDLIKELANGKPSISVDSQSRSFLPLLIHLRRLTIQRILGQELPKAGEYLSRLGLHVQKVEDGWKVEVPSRRWDLTREIDLVEEVARIHGYDNFPSDLPPNVVPFKIENQFEKIKTVKELCQSFGLQEIRSYSFATIDELKDFSSEVGEYIQVLNPLISDMGFMRQSICPALIQAWKANKDRQSKGVQLFEVGRVYAKSKDASVSPAKEELHLAAIFASEMQDHQWFQSSRTADFYDGKGFVEYLLSRCGISDVEFQQTNPVAFLHPGQSARIFVKGHFVGFVGALHPKILRKWDMSDVILVDILLDGLLPISFAASHYVPVSLFPFMERDIAMLVDEHVGVTKLISEMKAAKEPLIQSIRLFDVYSGKGVPQGKKSFAFRILFGSKERTLTDEEVDQLVQKIVNRMKVSFGATLRTNE